jgi:tripartite-type tricarboxylate transporter receptor subunit TctC
MTRLLLAVAFAILQAIGGAGAQVYPSRQITIVVPAVAGGSTDAIARVVANRLQAALGPPVVVENVAGAGGAIGTARVARAAPDGYTLGVGNWNSRVSAGVVYPAQYDALRDFEPIALLTNAPIWIVARHALPATSVNELIAWLKANPGKATAGFVGAGTASHLCGIHFQNTTGTRFQFAPYRSGAPAYSDLVAGHIDLMCAESSATAPHVRSGKLKAHAVLAKTRWFGAPDVPSVDEVGLPGLYMSFWQGLWAPRGTPKDVIARINSVVVDTFSDPAVRQRLTDQGLEIPPRELQTPEGFGAFHQAEIERWWPIIKAANIKPD